MVNLTMHYITSKYVDDLAEFADTTYRGVKVPEREITSRALTVIVPNLGTAGQKRLLRQIIQVGRQRGESENRSFQRRSTVKSATAHLHNERYSCNRTLRRSKDSGFPANLSW